MPCVHVNVESTPLCCKNQLTILNLALLSRFELNILRLNICAVYKEFGF